MIRSTVQFIAQVGEVNIGDWQRYGVNPRKDVKIVDTIIGNGIRILFVVAAIAFIFIFIWGAFDWIVSGGDKEKLANARKKIIAAITGLTLLALAFVILWVVGEILNFKILDPMCLPILTAPANAQPSDTQNCI